MPRALDLTGQRFGKLTAVRIVAEHGRRRWFCECECGGSTVTTTNKLTSGHTQTCGCTRSENMRASRLKHGKSRTGSVEYEIWKGMKARCENANHSSWFRYGGLGVSVCQRWRESFEAFLSDMGPRPSERHSIDRYPDKDGNYEPGNVRWATDVEQARNRRNSIMLTLGDVTRTLPDWSDATGISQNVLYMRYRKNWTHERILTTPVKVRS